MPSDADTIDDAMAENAAGPKSVAADGVSVTSHDIGQQIAAAKYLREQAAMDDNSGGWPMKTFKVSPPSARGQH